MKLGLNIRELRNSQLLRVIAMFFLLHSGADMLFPQLCNEENLQGGSFSQTLRALASKGDIAEALSIRTSSDFPEEQRSESQPRDEDCFCCCTHVMPSPAFHSFENIELATERSTAHRIFIPSVPPDNPYHPPRVA